MARHQLVRRYSDMGIHVDILGGKFEDDEVVQYVKRAEDLIAKGELPEDTCRITLEDAGDGEVDIRYYRDSCTPIERIRRITGYLTGTLSTWNDAKRAEEHDRVKHLSKANCPKRPCDSCDEKEDCVKE